MQHLTPHKRKNVLHKARLPPTRADGSIKSALSQSERVVFSVVEILDLIPARRLFFFFFDLDLHQKQGLFEAFFSFISRGVFTAVDVNNDGRIEDTEVEVAILKASERRIRRKGGFGTSSFFSLDLGRGFSSSLILFSLPTSPFFSLFLPENATNNLFPRRCTTWSTSACPDGKTRRRARRFRRPCTRSTRTRTACWTLAR